MRTFLEEWVNISHSSTATKIQVIVHWNLLLIGCMTSVMTSDKMLTLPKTHILGWNQMMLEDIRLMQKF